MCATMSDIMGIMAGITSQVSHRNELASRGPDMRSPRQASF